MLSIEHLSSTITNYLTNLSEIGDIIVTAMGSMMTLVIVGFLWGATNPLIKLGTKGVDKISEPNIFKKVIKEIIFLISNWQYTVPFIVNQCGSILYFFALKYAELTIAVPITNSLSFVFTALTGWLLGEETPDYVTLFGMILVAVGISCYALA